MHAESLLGMIGELFATHRSLPWFCHRGVQSEGRLGGYDWKLVVSVEVDQVSHTVKAPVPGPYNTLGINK